MLYKFFFMFTATFKIVKNKVYSYRRRVYILTRYFRENYFVATFYEAKTSEFEIPYVRQYFNFFLLEASSEKKDLINHCRKVDWIFGKR